MKKFSWASVGIGLLSGIGIAIVGVIIVALIAAGFGVSGVSLRHGRGLPILAKGLIYLVLLIVYYGSGYISSFIARPHGIYNAVILGIVFAVLTSDFAFWGIVRMMLAFSVTVFGGMSVNQHQ